MKERKVKAFVMMCIFLGLGLAAVIVGAVFRMPGQYFWAVVLLYGAFSMFAMMFVWGVVIADKVFNEGMLKVLIEQGKDFIGGGK